MNTKHGFSGDLEWERTRQEHIDNVYAKFEQVLPLISLVSR